MYRRTTAILILLALTWQALPVQAAFENVMVSPRARAMGDAGVAVPDAPYATYLNPALLAYAERAGSVGLSYTQPYGLSFNKLLYLGAQFRLPGRAGSLGLGLRQFGVDFEGVDLTKEGTLTLSHGIALYDDLHSSVALGYGLNLYQLEYAESVTGIDPGDDVSLGFDLALVATLHERTRVAFMIHNLNAPKIGVDEEELPRRLHGAVAYEPYTGVVTTLEVESLHGDKAQWRGGLELEVVENFDLRFGIATEPSKLSAGFGYDFKGFALNYAFSTGGGVLESTHQFGLTAAWGGDTK
jgi:hypothetical protein